MFFPIESAIEEALIILEHLKIFYEFALHSSVPAQMLISLGTFTRLLLEKAE